MPVRGVDNRIGQSDVEHLKGKPAGFFGIFTSSKASFLYRNEGSHYTIFCPDDLNEILSLKLTMGETTRPLYSVFVAYGYQQHAGAVWHSKYFLYDHIYLILEDVQLKDAVTSALSNIFRIA